MVAVRDLVEDLVGETNYILAESRLVVVVWWYDWQESLHHSLDGTINNLNNWIIASKNIYWRTSASIWCKVYSLVTWGDLVEDLVGELLGEDSSKKRRVTCSF